MQANKNRLVSGAIFICSAVLLIIAWHMAAKELSPLILPGPGITWARLTRLWTTGEVAKQLWISCRRTIAGFAIAYVTAVFLALSMHRWRFVHQLLQPWLTAVQMVPTVIWLILAVLWFGIAREKTPIFVVFIVCMPVVLVQIREGLSAIPKELVDLAALEPMGFLSYSVNVAWPSLRPFLLSAATLGFSFAWRSVVFAEFVGSNSGLGYQLSRSYHNLATDEVFAWAIVLIVLMWLWQSLLVDRWRTGRERVTTPRSL
jgi:NitT/TauT family transport system permease protein